ncbi:jerky protein homolog-like [Trichonephila clavata]|uniref:Jerky protein homolog-like n=1 Tax=Trichonephila clavata TaxID=2740835 RepID=A0A8X6I9Z0_TRICU|nr:jerky protein homolog-like [Trichonephila clavata]
MPPGSHVEMNETSAYNNSDVFMKFLRNHFIPRKESGKVLLILDSHASRCSDVAVLDLAAEIDFGSLLNAAWSKAATVGNGTSGFSATGIYPYNRQEIPQYPFAISDGSSNDTAVASTSGAGNMPTSANASTRSRLSSSVASPST